MNVRQLNHAQQLEHRLKMIKDDLEVIKQFIYDEKLDECFCIDTRLGGDPAWANISNIEIACDLSSDESLHWGMLK